MVAGLQVGLWGRIYGPPTYRSRGPGPATPPQNRKQPAGVFERFHHPLKAGVPKLPLSGDASMSQGSTGRPAGGLGGQGQALALSLLLSVSLTLSSGLMG